jgi:hypothetical protein
MFHDMKYFWHPSVLESFLLLNTQFFTVYVVMYVSFVKMEYNKKSLKYYYIRLYSRKTCSFLLAKNKSITMK